MQARLAKICCFTCHRRKQAFCERVCPFVLNCKGVDECVWHQCDCDDYRDHDAKFKMPRKKAKLMVPYCNCVGKSTYEPMVRSGPGYYCTRCGRYE